jgi:hypothetical protein
VHLKQEAMISLHYPGQFLKNDFRRNMVQPETGIQLNIDVKHQVSAIRFVICKSPTNALFKAPHLNLQVILFSNKGYF